MIPFLLFTKSGSGNPFAYAAASFDPSFISNFLLTQTVLWVLVLVNPLALLPAIAFMLIMIGVGGEIYFQFPYQYLGSSFKPPGGYYYYGMFMPPMMAAVAFGIAKLKPNQKWRLHVSMGLLLIPGIAYGIYQFKYLASRWQVVHQIQSFQAAYIPDNAVVVTDYTLSAFFANRDQMYVYLQPPKGIYLPQIFSLADVAVIRKGDNDIIQSAIFQRSTQQWQRIMESTNFVFYKKN